MNHRFHAQHLILNELLDVLRFRNLRLVEEEVLDVPRKHLDSFQVILHNHCYELVLWTLQVIQFEECHLRIETCKFVLIPVVFNLLLVGFMLLLEITIPKPLLYRLDAFLYE